MRKELVLKVRYKPSVYFSALSYHKPIGFITGTPFRHPVLLTVSNCGLLLFAGHNGRPCPDNRCQAHQQNCNHEPWPGGHGVSGRHTSPSPFPPPPPGHWSHLRASTRPWTADGSSWTEAHWKNPITCSKAEKRPSQRSDRCTFSTDTRPGYWASVLGSMFRLSLYAFWWPWAFCYRVATFTMHLQFTSSSLKACQQQLEVCGRIPWS